MTQGNHPNNSPRLSRHCALDRLETRSMLSAIPLSGDWNGDGIDTVALYSPQSGEFFIRNDNSPGFADARFQYGPANSSLVPVAGDWNNDGQDSVGLYDLNSGTFFLKNALAPGAADDVFSFGAGGIDWLPLAGNWDGLGGDSVGIYSPATGHAFLRNSLTPGPADLSFSFGPAGSNWLPFAGDWDGDSVDTLGLYEQDTGFFFLRNSNSTGIADLFGQFGPSGTDWLPIGGQWDVAPNRDGVGLFQPGAEIFYLRNDSLAISGPADATFHFVSALDSNPVPSPTNVFLTAAEVEQLLQRAEAASASNDAIIAVVDRMGRILGVRVEAGVPINPADTPTLVFAIDGAVAKARTASYFANGDIANGTAGPLTSRTVRFLSQSTVTQREVESNPNSADPTIRGPGFVAPIGLGGHVPPEIQHTPLVDLFAIEHTNRDSLVHPGADGIKGTADDIDLPSRFNVNPAFIPDGQEIFAPESYGLVSGLMPSAQARGIATLPGGIPLYKDTNDDGFGDTLVGGIGVFFPGPNGYATFEQGFVPGYVQSENQRTNAPRVLEAEWIAFAAAGGSRGFNFQVGNLSGVPPVAGLDFPAGRIDLVGITLEIIGPHPRGLDTIRQVGQSVGRALPTLNDSLDQVVEPGLKYIGGIVAPQGWLVLPHDSPLGSITTEQVQQIVSNGIADAQQTRAAIRLPLGSRTSMVFSIADTDGNVLGLYRMPDATYFSIDVATAKARNTAYYADPSTLQAIDRVEVQPGGDLLAAGVAFTNRTFRFLSGPRFPTGAETAPPGPFSILNDPGFAINPATGLPGVENAGPPQPFTAFQSVLGFDAFNPGTNFRDPGNIANQNGIVFFPGSSPLYQNSVLIGGFGVSGDGVDQDDVVTFFGAREFLPPTDVTRADQVFVRTVRLPFQKFNRNPRG